MIFPVPKVILHTKGLSGVLDVMLYVKFELGQTVVGPVIAPRIGLATTSTTFVAVVLQKEPGVVVVAVTIYVPGFAQVMVLEVPVTGEIVTPVDGVTVHVAFPLAK
jgi:hypothetical protein